MLHGCDQPVVLIGQAHRHAKIPVVKPFEGPAVANENAIAFENIPLQAGGRLEACGPSGRAGNWPVPEKLQGRE